MRKNSICASQSSAESGQPWLNTMLPAAPILVENFGAVLGGDRRHCLSFLPSVESPTLLVELSHGLWASPVRTAPARASMMPSMNARFFLPPSQSQAIGSLSL